MELRRWNIYGNLTRTQSQHFFLLIVHQSSKFDVGGASVLVCVGTRGNIDVTNFRKINRKVKHDISVTNP